MADDFHGEQCKCADTAPTYPVYRKTPHLPTCRFYRSNLELLRAEQGQRVMAQIGSLLDAWDGMSNDLKSQIREETPSFVGAINRIWEAMDGSFVEGPNP